MVLNPRLDKYNEIKICFLLAQNILLCPAQQDETGDIVKPIVVLKYSTMFKEL